jgi:hypothetical protein
VGIEEVEEEEVEKREEEAEVELEEEVREREREEEREEEKEEEEELDTCQSWLQAGLLVLLVCPEHEAGHPGHCLALVREGAAPTAQGQGVDPPGHALHGLPHQRGQQQLIGCRAERERTRHTYLIS